MRVFVWFQFFRFVRMVVRAMFPLVLMLVFVDVVVLVSVLRPIVRVLVCMRMSVFVLMAVIVH